MFLVHSPGSSRPTVRGCHHKRGVALVLVLTSLVLLSILVIGILVSARQEAVTSKAYGAGSDVQILADTATNLVMAQIVSATANPDETWISQPGLLRTFTAAGQQKAYKLYSSYKMVEDNAYDPGAAATLDAEVPMDWYKRPQEFVDLNRPVDFGTRKVYPIVDPTVLNANDSAQNLVQGFSFDATGRIETPSNAGSNPLPMPVRWMYVDSGGKFLGVSDADRKKAVARVAFWTDDETSKVNLNTASGGIFFDTPAVNTVEDHNLGRTQPIAQEYQRWPGHPSETSLGPVIKALHDIVDPVARSKAASLLTPRIAWGGSEGGARYAWLDRNLGTTDLDRLYASPDEFVYNGSILSGTQRVANTVNGVSLENSSQGLDKLHFFLTTQGRAPELNLFNRPRVAIWPFNQEMVAANLPPTDPNALALTPEDRLIRLASEVGGVNGDGTLDYNKRKRFYFQRKSAWDPAADWRDIPENRALYHYLQNQTSRLIPGKPSRAGSDLATKFGPANRDQILAECWDYIRSNINTVNQAYQPVGFPPYSFPQKHNTEMAGFNDVAPLVIGEGTKPKGFGRFPVLTQVIAQFINAGESFDVTSNNTEDKTHVVRKVRLVLLLNFSMPVNHLMQSYPRFQVDVTGIKPFNFVTNEPTLNAGLTEPIQVRNVKGGDAAWVNTLSAATGIGFPGKENDSVFRTRCYVDLFGIDKQTYAGNMGIAYAMLTPLVNSVDASNSANTWWNVHRLKVLSNRFAPTSLTQADKDQFAMFPDTSRDDVYYPFVSDVIEFRLPQVPSTTPPTAPKAGNGKSAHYDYFEALLTGGELAVTIYPGLKDTATALSPVLTNWQTPSSDPASGNYLMKTTISFANDPAAPTIIPLPRLGPADVLATMINTYKSSPTTEPMMFSEMQDYYKRGRAQKTDFLMAVGPDAVVKQMDVFRSYVLSAAAPLNGDLRLAALCRDIPGAWWLPYTRNERGTFFGSGYFPEYIKYLVSSGDPEEKVNIVPNGAASAFCLDGSTRLSRLHANIPSYTRDLGVQRTAAPLTTASIRDGSATVGDFTLGFGDAFFGALVAGPDTGSVSNEANAQSLGSTSPYFNAGITRAGTDDSAANSSDSYHRNLTGILFSPFKQSPSPVLFGTLPSRAAGTTPGSWETLLFSPNPAGGKGNHRGWTAPRDHFLLDLFYMPVVEPYAITEDLASTGKVNLNYQIAPFTYIKRKTQIHALLDGMTASGKAANSTGALLGVQDSVAMASATQFSFRSPNFKLNGAQAVSYRSFVDIDETLKAFDARLDNNNDPFVSASEICEMPLIPVGRTQGNVDAFWDARTLTGDDKREMPYNHLYPRVTTRSNTFRIHYWVQTLNPTLGRDKPIVTGEYRGSALIERYLDPNLLDYGTAVGDGTSINVDSVFPALSDKYRFRKIESQQFSP